MSTRVLVGHVTVSKPFEVTELFEFAAWWRQHRVLTGTYPVYAWVEFHPTRVDRLTVTYSTQVLDEYLAPHFGGVPVGPTRKDDVGKESTVSRYRYHYELPDDVVMRGRGQMFNGHFVFVPGAYGVAYSRWLPPYEDARYSHPGRWLHNLRDTVPAPGSVPETWTTHNGDPVYARRPSAWVPSTRTWAELVEDPW